MADYAQKARSTNDGNRPASSVRARRSVPAAVEQQPHATGQSLQTALRRGVRTQAIAQLWQSIRESPRVAQLARISAMLQRASRPKQEELPQMQVQEGTPLNDDEGLKHEADVMGRRVTDDGRGGAHALGSFDAGFKNGYQAPAQLVPETGTRPVVQRLTIKNDPRKLSFVIDELGRHTKELFRNANDDQLTQFIRDVNVYWRAAYSSKRGELTLDSATAPIKSNAKELLATLGKTTPEQADYKRLSDAVSLTFVDDTDDRYRLATRKPESVQALPPGSEWWLDKVQDEGLVTAEDKSTDRRLMADTSQDHIVKTTADTRDTATALFEIDQQSSGVQEIAADDRTWELHGHVRQDGAVEFAHTKADEKHKVTVTDWFASHIDEGDRTWTNREIR